MSYFRLIVIAVLLLLPISLFSGVGAWAIWHSGHLLWLSWTLPLCWGLAWFLFRRARQSAVALPHFGARAQWTPQDKAAATIVEAEQKNIGDQATTDQLTDLRFFRERTLDLATKLAKHYHPKAVEPLNALSVVEIFAVVRLVSEDLEEWFLQNVPGSHLISVGQWRMLAQAPGWWKAASDTVWIASIVLNPFSLIRYAASKAFVDPMTKQIQSNLFGAFCMLYIRQVGFYLIELNSGRLRGGSARYRRAMDHLQDRTYEARTTTEPHDPEPVTVTIAIVGQVKAGKSSLVNSLLGEQRAAVDVLPLTRDVARYELRLEETNDRLVLLDTPGYSDVGATPAQLAASREAVRHADLILLVMDARSPAKLADANVLTELNSWFREQHRLKPPPMVGIVSKIDGLSPIMEWSPPYNLEQPSSPKEQAIRDAVEYASQAVGGGLAAIVPVCTDRERGRVFGIEEWLLPTISLHLDEARACSLVRSLHHDHDRLKAWQVFSQLVQAGQRIKDAVQALNDPHLS